jgi:hypothetical protein
MGDVGTNIQVAAAMLVVMAVLFVFLCPLTFGPPAPQQKHSSILVLLATVLAAIGPLVSTVSTTASTLQFGFVRMNTPSERLALFCSRLC